MTLNSPQIEIETLAHLFQAGRWAAAASTARRLAQAYPALATLAIPLAEAADRSDAMAAVARLTHLAVAVDQMQLRRSAERRRAA